MANSCELCESDYNGRHFEHCLLWHGARHGPFFDHWLQKLQKWLKRWVPATGTIDAAALRELVEAAVANGRAEPLDDDRLLQEVVDGTDCRDGFDDGDGSSSQEEIGDTVGGNEACTAAGATDSGNTPISNSCEPCESSVDCCAGRRELPTCSPERDRFDGSTEEPATRPG